jgi:hypothetical protein
MWIQINDVNMHGNGERPGMMNGLRTMVPAEDAGERNRSSCTIRILRRKKIIGCGPGKAIGGKPNYENASFYAVHVGMK